MKSSYAIALVLGLLAMPASGEDAVATANRIMRAALLERAPVPTSLPSLPDRGTPGALTREHLATRAEAEQVGRSRADRDAAAKSHELKAEMANRAAMRPVMTGCAVTEPGTGCAGQMPADMMKSRGMMAGGGMMPSGGGMPGGMPGGGGGMNGGGGTPMGGGSSSGTGMLHESPTLAPGGAQR